MYQQFSTCLVFKTFKNELLEGTFLKETEFLNETRWWLIADGSCKTALQ